ncbi:unnamed protein product, partial [Adineta ricciae]
MSHLLNTEEICDEECEKQDNSHTLYQLLVDWYGTSNLNRSLSSTQLTDQWTTLWFAKRELQRLADEKLMKYHSAIEHFLDFQPATLKEKIALIILYDQVTRNIFRGTANAYKYDNKAQQIALSLIENVTLSDIPIQFLLTILICLIHSEQIQHVDLVKDRIEQYVSTNSSVDSNLLRSLNGIVRNHYDRLELFGRIPERNRFINRESTPAEISYMQANKLKRRDLCPLVWNQVGKTGFIDDEETATFFYYLIDESGLLMSRKDFRRIQGLISEVFNNRLLDRSLTFKDNFSYDVVLKVSDLSKSLGVKHTNHDMIQLVINERLGITPQSTVRIREWIIFNAREQKFEIVDGIRVEELRSLIKCDPNAPNKTKELARSYIINAFSMCDAQGTPARYVDLHGFHGSFTPDFYP